MIHFRVEWWLVFLPVTQETRVRFPALEVSFKLPPTGRKGFVHYPAFFLPQQKRGRGDRLSSGEIMHKKLVVGRLGLQSGICHRSRRLRGDHKTIVDVLGIGGKTPFIVPVEMAMESQKDSAKAAKAIEMMTLPFRLRQRNWDQQPPKLYSVK